MLNWESEITKTWQFTVPVPLASLSISSWTPSVVFTRRVPAAVHFLARHGVQIDKKPELVFGVELFQSHVLWFVIFLS